MHGTRSLDIVIKLIEEWKIHMKLSIIKEIHELIFEDRKFDLIKMLIPGDALSCLWKEKGLAVSAELLKQEYKNKYYIRVTSIFHQKSSLIDS